MSRYGAFRKLNLAESEHSIQAAFVRALEMTGKPEIAVSFAIPNAAKRSFRVMAMLKAEGFRTGMPDWCLPVARGPYNALWIEFKRPKQKPTIQQQEMHRLLKEHGGLVLVETDSMTAVQSVLNYLDMKPQSRHL